MPFPKQPSLRVLVLPVVLVLSHIPFPLYFGASFLFSFAYAFMFYVLGDSIDDREPGQGISVLLLLLSVGGIGWFIRRRLKRGRAETKRDTV